jgi:hypothetical protein
MISPLRARVGGYARLYSHGADYGRARTRDDYDRGALWPRALEVGYIGAAFWLIDRGDVGLKKKKNLIACRGLGRVAGPLLAARVLPLRCAASTMLSSALLAI